MGDLVVFVKNYFRNMVLNIAYKSQQIQILKNKSNKNEKRIQDKNNQSKSNNNTSAQRSNQQIQIILRSFITHREKTPILNPGYLDEVKRNDNTRILFMNLHSLRPSNDDKINMLIHECQKRTIDAMILSKTNIKQTRSN